VASLFGIPFLGIRVVSDDTTTSEAYQPKTGEAFSVSYPSRLFTSILVVQKKHGVCRALYLELPFHYFTSIIFLDIRKSPAWILYT
jgi:hypothetical protein